MTFLVAIAGALLPLGVGLIILGIRPAPVVTTAAPTRPSRLAKPRRLTPTMRIVCAISVALGLLIAATTGWLLAIVLLPAAAIGLPRLLSAPNAEQQIRRLDAMQDWTRALAGAMAVGLGLEAAIKQSVRSVPASIRPDATTEEALRAFAEDLNDPIGDLHVANLIQANQLTGVPLSDVLADIADSIAADVRGRRDVEADRAKPRTSARIITLIFITTIGGLFFTPYTAPLRTPLGQIVLSVEIVLFVLALIWLRRMAVVPESPRFLDDTRLPTGATR